MGPMTGGPNAEVALLLKPQQCGHKTKGLIIQVLFIMRLQQYLLLTTV